MKFSSKENSEPSAHLSFPINPSKILLLTDVHQGAQDHIIPGLHYSWVLLSFKTCSISGFIIHHNTPIHWVSKQKQISARSSTEAKIYVLDECVKAILHLQYILSKMDVKHLYTASNGTIRMLKYC